MRRILDVRIVRWELKALYVVGAIIIGFVIAGLLRLLGLAEIGVSITATAIDVGALLLGARIFRGRGEAIEPPRPWWRMTARPTLSRRLGILFVVLSAFGLISLGLTAIGVPALRTRLADGVSVSTTIFVALEYGGFAFFYLNSAARLKRLGVPPLEPKFRPAKTLKL